MNQGSIKVKSLNLGEKMTFAEVYFGNSTLLMTDNPTAGIDTATEFHE